MIAVGFLFGQPNAGQIQGGLAGAIQAQTVRGQTQAGHMSIEIPRWKILIFNFLEKNSEVHAFKVMAKIATVKAATTVSAAKGCFDRPKGSGIYSHDAL